MAETDSAGALPPLPAPPDAAARVDAPRASLALAPAARAVVLRDAARRALRIARVAAPLPLGAALPVAEEHAQTLVVAEVCRAPARHRAHARAHAPLR